MYDILTGLFVSGMVLIIGVCAATLIYEGIKHWKKFLGDD